MEKILFKGEYGRIGQHADGAVWVEGAGAGLAIELLNALGRVGLDLKARDEEAAALKAANERLRALCVDVVERLSCHIAELDFSERYADADYLREIADDMVKAAGRGEGER